MDRCIYAELMKTKIKNYSKPGDPYYGLDEDLREWIDQQPTANVRENVMGKWQITDAYPHNVYCSECHKRFAQTHWSVWEDGSLPRNFCPNCGADMRGERSES